MAVTFQQQQQHLPTSTLSDVADKPSTLSDIGKHSFSSDADRQRWLLEAYKLVARLETPWETCLRLGMAQPALYYSLKVASDLNLFELWEEHTKGAISIEELATLVKCDPTLLLRIVRHLAANNVFEQVDVKSYRQTELSRSFLNPVFGDWIAHTYDATLPSALHAPKFLADHKYRNPRETTDTIFQFAKGTRKELFEFYDSEPRESNTFNNIMGGVMMHQASWLDIFPHESLLQGLDETSAVVVDVGGNVGRDLDRFRVAHPELASRLVLEDRPEVVEASVCPDPVVKLGHDFFQPQPIEGARAYYLHGVLHDWSDEQAKAILRRLHAAAKPGYTKLLIHEHVIASENPHPAATAYDMTMMVMVSALERSETAWKELLAATGFRIIKIWSSAVAAQSVIEAEMVV